MSEVSDHTTQKWLKPLYSEPLAKQEFNCTQNQNSQPWQPPGYSRGRKFSSLHPWQSQMKIKTLSTQTQWEASQTMCYCYCVRLFNDWALWNNMRQPCTIWVEREGSVWSHERSKRENKGRVCLACLCFSTLHNREADLSMQCDFSDGAGARNAEIELRTVETNIYGGDRVRG